MIFPRHTATTLAQFALLAAALCCEEPHAEPPSPIHGVSLAVPRDFGIVMGDTVHADIRVRLEPGYALETALLPLADGAVSDVLEIRSVDWSQESGGNESIYRVGLTYQVFKGVREPEILQVPPVPLHFKKGEQTVETAAPARPMTLMPIIPTATPDEKVALRDSLPPLALPDAGRPAMLAAFFAALAGLSGGFAWYLNRPAKAAPFRLAGRALRKLRGRSGELEAFKDALRTLHEALNQTAGHTLFLNQLPEFLNQHPEFAGLQTELEEFFRLSQRLFFSHQETSLPADYPFPRLETLCRALAKVEKSKP